MTLMIGDNSVVSINYKLTDDAGKVLDSSEGSGPLVYLQGAGNIIPGLEKVLVGKVEGDSVQVTIEPEEAYGAVSPELVQTVDRAAFHGIDSLEEGMVFEAQGQDGSVQRVIVQHIDGDRVTVDGNHPLAGVVLHFDVEVVGVREATEEEIAHGHAH